MTTEIKELLLSIDASMASDFFSFEEECLYYDMGSIQMIWTGADSTSAKLIPEVSNNKVNWCSLLSADQILKVNATDGCQIYMFPSLPFKYYRIKFEKMANTTGTITIISILKRRRGRGG